MLNADGLTQENTPDIQMAEVDLSAHQLAFHEIESFEPNSFIVRLSISGDFYHGQIFCSGLGSFHSELESSPAAPRARVKPLERSPPEIWNE